MDVIKEKPIRKTVFRGQKSLSINTFDTIILTKNQYTTNGENLIIVRDVDACKIKLDSTTTDNIRIKTLTKCVILPDVGRIDDDWDEISIGKGACIELQNVRGVWYILSSDGVKMD
jgi:hypothetical protein